LIILNLTKDKFKEILKEYFEYKFLEDKIRKQIEKMFFKLTEFARKMIAKEIDVIFYVKNLDSFITEPLYSKINSVSDEAKLYLYYLLMEYFKDEIQIVVEKCKKEEIEIFKLINTVIYSIEYTQGETNFTLDLDKIDSLYSKKPSNIAKNARKSIVSTLTNKKRERIFRVHPAAKKRIVFIEELKKAKKLDLGNKEFNCRCPVCNQKKTITSENINDFIKINKDEVIFMCDHEKTDKFKELPFKINLQKFLGDKIYSKREKQMFFINNFKKLTTGEF
jgi:hypothetical protein